ncbi:TPR_11 domain-containing protein [Cephalotus follicularis]|uniref:TPR_11 domain-containing protein n=1 Tax=Cephalotus follicularis TaxID=3775 RepID=A0A1Q3DD24_CEPFO|nr:TPR_11 domain-containing protein [Cephalotus follicularis]
MDTNPESESEPDLLKPQSTETSLNDLAHDLTSLLELAQRGSWRSILDKVTRARSLSLLSKPHDHLTYLSFYVFSLTKLRRFADAASELDSLQDLDSHRYLYESYPQFYPNRTGSLIPFSLRWLHALIPSKLGNRLEGLDRLYSLLDFVRQRIKSKNNVSFNVWRKREVFLVNCIIGQHLAAKEFVVCLDLFNELINRDDSLDPVLLSKLGYLQMQIGDFDGAKSSFSRIESMLKEGRIDSVSFSESELNNLVNRNRALVFLVGKDYVSAVREYDECIERDHEDVVAINNKAICLMYLRDLSDSIKVLENSLERVPTVALNETLVVNLCSMYELAYINHSDIKSTLSNWISLVAPDDFDATCTRI